MSKIVAAALAAAMVFGAGPVPAQAEVPDDRDPFVEDQRKRGKGQTIREIRWVRDDRIAWGEERKFNRTTVITLDPPLPRALGAGVVEVEWFGSLIDHQGREGVGTTVLNLLIERWRVWRQPGVVLVLQPVGSGPALDPSSEARRRLYQEMMLAWGPVSWQKNLQRTSAQTATIHLTNRPTRNVTRAGAIASRAVAEAEVARMGLSPARWMRLLEQDETRDRIARTDARWTEIVTQGQARYRRAFDGYADPVLVINGRYLITARTMRRHGGRAVENVLRAANRMIREELEKDPSRLAQVTRARKRIAYDSEEHAKREGAIELEPAMETPEQGKVTVEWFYSYADQLARTAGGRTEWWAAKLPQAARFVKSPVIATHAKDQRAKRRHQELLVASRQVIWEDTVQHHLRRRLDAMGQMGLIRNRGQLREFLKDARMPMEDYRRGLEDPRIRETIEGIDRRYARVRDVAGDLEGTDPVLLVNGRYLLLGSRFDSLEEVFHTANVLVRKELEARQ